jgi:CMP-2-keto-3-deoxyoctulosonic acid synthetase
MSRDQRITLNDVEYVEQLLIMARGNRALVDEAVSACAEGPDGASDLKRVIQYIVSHQPPPAAA